MSLSGSVTVTTEAQQEYCDCDWFTAEQHQFLIHYIWGDGNLVSNESISTRYGYVQHKRVDFTRLICSLLNFYYFFFKMRHCVMFVHWYSAVSSNLKAPRHVSDSFIGFPYQHGVEISLAVFLGKFQAVWFQRTVLLTN